MLKALSDAYPSSNASAPTARSVIRSASFASDILHRTAYACGGSPTSCLKRAKEQFQLTARASKGATGFILMNEGIWGSPGYFYLGQNLPWCTCDFPRDNCFLGASRDPRVNRAVYWSNANPAEGSRDADAKAAFEAAGFHVVEQRGHATLFER